LSEGCAWSDPAGSGTPPRFLQSDQRPPIFLPPSARPTPNLPHPSPVPSQRRAAWPATLASGGSGWSGVCPQRGSTVVPTAASAQGVFGPQAVRRRAARGRPPRDEAFGGSPRAGPRHGSRGILGPVQEPSQEGPARRRRPR
jgi:hypothetical protein